VSDGERLTEKNSRQPDKSKLIVLQNRLFFFPAEKASLRLSLFCSSLAFGDRAKKVPRASSEQQVSQ
jgi:hypothetical protein